MPKQLGEPRTILQMCQSLARLGKAETTCPAKTLQFWKWLAFVFDGLGGKGVQFIDCSPESARKSPRMTSRTDFEKALTISLI